MSKLSPSVSRPRVITDDDDDDDNDHQKGIQWETGRVEYHEGKVLSHKDEGFPNAIGIAVRQTVA